MSIRQILFDLVDETSRSQGLALYQKGMARLGSVETVHGSEHTLHIQGQVGNDVVSLHLLDNAIPEHTCTCHNKGLCAHVVAILSAYADTITQLEPVSESIRAGAVEELLRIFTAKKNSPTILENTVHLLPLLHFDPYGKQFSLSFRITCDHEHNYIIKNLSEFAERLKKQQLHEYGKWLSFYHERNAFSEDSQHFLDLISDSVALSSRGKYAFNQSDSLIKRHLYLTDSQFDAFFDHISTSSQQIESQIASEPIITLRLLQKDVTGTLYINEEGQGRFRLRLNIGKWRLYRSQKHHYLFSKQEIIRPSLDFQRSVLPLYKHLQPLENKDIHFNKTEMIAFLATAEPILSNYLHVAISPVLRQKLISKPLKISLRLDYPATNAIRGVIHFSYGSTSFNPLEDGLESPSIYRDIISEDYFLERLYHYRFSKNEDELLLLGEDALFTFLQEGLAELLKLATIDIEDTLAGMRPKPAGIPAIKTSIGKGIIEVKFDETLFPVEELVEVLRAYRIGKKFIRLRNEHYLDIVTTEVAQLDAFLQDVGVSPDALLNEDITLKTYHAARLEELQRTSLLNIELDGDLHVLATRLQNFDDLLIMPQPSLKATLRTYQHHGLKWMVNLSELGLGGILADDMGLGKTIQAISFLLHRKISENSLPSIIVAPTSLIYNWQEEIDRFAPSLNYVVLCGQANERRELLQEVASTTLIITSYATLRRDAEYYEHMCFDTVIADEAQYIKNSHTQSAKVLKTLKASHRFALTGTPMENSLADLWSIMDFCMPGYLHSWQTFRNVYEIPITRYEDTDRLHRLRRFVAPFLLRRVKKEVLTELPNKIETTLYAEFSTEESRIYQAQLALSQKSFVDCMRNEKAPQSRIKIFALLMRLRQVCCSPSLFLDNYKVLSSKERLVMELISERISGGHKIVLFSQFTRMLDKLAKNLDEAAIPYLMLTGQTKTNERMVLVNQFQNNQVPIFLISLKAGGVGLNLTNADTVIHYDPWWNQSVENQATDRTHRIGQNESVHVIRLICKNSIEEKIMALQQRKNNLTENVIDHQGDFFARLTKDDLQELFAMG